MKAFAGSNDTRPELQWCDIAAVQQIAHLLRVYTAAWGLIHVKLAGTSAPSTPVCVLLATTINIVLCDT